MQKMNRQEKATLDVRRQETDTQEIKIQEREHIQGINRQ
jgi:hypothetical protein